MAECFPEKSTRGLTNLCVRVECSPKGYLSFVHLLRNDDHHITGLSHVGDVSECRMKVLSQYGH